MSESASSNQIFQVEKIKGNEDKIVFNKNNGEALFKKLIDINNNSRTNKLLYANNSTPDDLAKKVSLMINQFNKEIDTNVLVSREDKIESFEKSKIVSENDFDNEIAKKVNNLNSEIQSSLNGMGTHFDDLMNSLSGVLNVESFVKSLPETGTFNKLSMASFSGDYKKEQVKVDQNPLSKPEYIDKALPKTIINENNRQAALSQALKFSQ